MNTTSAIGVAVFTRNGVKAGLEATLRALANQSLPLRAAIVLDTSSRDGSPQLAQQLGFTVIPVAQKEFNHGTTRQQALQRLGQSGCDIAILMTQDAELADAEALTRLIEAFADANVAVAYSRQISRADASFFERRSRQVNYPDRSEKRTESDRKRLGWRSIFCSDTCAAWRISAVNEVGGFPQTDFGEDMLLADRLLLAGKKIAYVADSVVIHSHPTTVRELFRRGREIGQFHRNHPELQERCGKAEKNALALFRTSLLHPACFLSAVIKYLGYLAGKRKR